MSGSDVFIECSLETIRGAAFFNCFRKAVSLGPIDVKKLYLRVLILLLRAFRCGTMHLGPVLSLRRRSFSANEIFLCGGDLSLRRISFSVKEISL